MRKLIFLLGATMLAVSAANAAIIATYNFTGGPSATPAAVNGATFGAFTRGSALVNRTATDEFGASGWTTASSLTANNYVSFVITPNAGATANFVLNSVRFDANTGNRSPTSLLVRIVYGSTTVDSSVFTLTRNTTSGNDGLTFTPSSPISTKNPITVSFYGWRASNTGASDWISFDNVAIDGIAPVPEPVNVAMGIFAGVLVVGGMARSRVVRGRVQSWRAVVNQWIDAV